MDPIGAADLTFIGYKQTERQTSKVYIDNSNIIIDIIIVTPAVLLCVIYEFFYYDKAKNLNIHNTVW